MPPAAGFLSGVALMAAQAEDGPSAKRANTRVSLGLLVYCFALAQKAQGKVAGVPNYSDPQVFIREAAALGASSIQFPFGQCEPEKARAIRALAESSGVALEATLGLPSTESDLPRFEGEMQTLQALGVGITRTVVFAGRRYEDLHSYRAYEEALAGARKRLRLAEPVARKLGIRLAVENHKDQRAEDRVKLLREFDSEYIGACVDVGNNISLLEDPVEVCRALAPWALTVHFKDQGVREYEEGFVLADVPLGQGCIDLPEVIRVVRAAKPAARFQLELITRDPLKVPVLRNDYWGSLPEVKASEFSRTWAMVKQRGSRAPFPTVSGLPDEARVAMERRNIEESFRFAASHLDLSA